MALVGKTPTIKNLALTTGGTEYNYTLPTGTKKFILQCRTGEELQFAFVKGESGSNYFTVVEGASHFEDDLNASDLTLYIQCVDSNKVAEILSWAT